MALLGAPIVAAPLATWLLNSSYARRTTTLTTRLLAAPALLPGSRLLAESGLSKPGLLTSTLLIGPRLAESTRRSGTGLLTESDRRSEPGLLA